MDQTNTILSLPNQQETLQGVLQNNDSVQRSLYAEVFPKVRIYILQNKGNEAHAKDIFQDAFLVFWKNKVSLLLMLMGRIKCCSSSYKKFLGSFPNDKIGEAADLNTCQR